MPIDGLTDIKLRTHLINYLQELGIAYPISDRGVIHMSYGHFFQNPQFSF